MMTWIALMGLLAGAVLLTRYEGQSKGWDYNAGWFFAGAFALGLMLHLLGYF
jgi:hypothetical protein